MTEKIIYLVKGIDLEGYSWIWKAYEDKATAERQVVFCQASDDEECLHNHYSVAEVKYYEND